MNSLKILHLANDYAGSAVYKNLVAALDQEGLTQIVYCPVRNASLIDKNKIGFKNASSQIIYSHILNKTTDRIIYPLKIKKILRDIERKIDLSQVNFIHAHTWYSDGGVAYFLSRKYNIPYITAIRNTDLNLFQKRLFYLRPFGRKILNRAIRVILIAASYKKRILSQNSLQSIKSDLEKKIKTIPNGVDPYWIANTISSPKTRTDKIFNVLFIGKFTKSKNIVALQHAVRLLNQENNKSIKLHIVGGGGRKLKEVITNVEQYPDVFKYYGQIFDKDELLKCFRNCDVFAMPSKYETFGLVYVEALLQGMPILYQKNEGIDGFYDEKIGEAVTVGDAEEIKEKLRLLYENFDSYEFNIPLIKQNHDWRLIAKEYLAIYEHQ
ncbi:glycosyltransferase [Agriterribacter sp.]|uniref:glycosyltransferase n=1 Tax=Agriterribacter sp. TaxID=2821509 RepID=UPI002C4F93A2|nr:glycosyltransferase [Agriterribacter sp.]HRO47708.1 glycosyltransferase [Agriterribacter sp.]HRQ18077.1 glycosyltransferase [Agriterribacter sp.]